MFLNCSQNEYFMNIRANIQWYIISYIILDKYRDIILNKSRN